MNMRKYELATSAHWKFDSTGKIPFTESIERIVRAGFKNLDFCFLNMHNNSELPFLSDNYLDWVREVGQFTDSIGAKFVQAHAPDTSDPDRLFELAKRSILSCAQLGIPWLVFHSPSRGKLGYEKESAEFNFRYFSSLLPLARDCGVGIAIENLVCEFDERLVANTTDRLIELIDRFDSEYVGACWDTGHAHVGYAVTGAEEIAHQSVQLKKLGERLKCTHIHDNSAKRFSRMHKLPPEKAGVAFAALDEHIAPFQGDIDWKDVIDGLDAIDYKHYFTYESHQSINPLPDSIADDAMRMMYKIGEAILAM